MSNQNLIKRAVLSALGVLAYISALSLFMGNIERTLGQRPDTWFAPVLFLLIFLVSACVTASLVLLKPILLYVEGQKKDAVRLFGYTVASLAVLALLVFSGMLLL